MGDKNKTFATCSSKIKVFNLKIYKKNDNTTIKRRN